MPGLQYQIPASSFKINLLKMEKRDMSRNNSITKTLELNMAEENPPLSTTMTSFSRFPEMKKMVLKDGNSRKLLDIDGDL